MCIRFDWAFGNQEGLKPSGRLVLLALTWHANAETGLCWPSRATIQADTGLGTTAVRDGLADLKRAGLVEETGIKVGRTGNVKMYRLAGARTGWNIRTNRASDAPFNRAAGGGNRADSAPFNRADSERNRADSAPGTPHGTPHNSEPLNEQCNYNYTAPDSSETCSKKSLPGAGQVGFLPVEIPAAAGTPDREPENVPPRRRAEDPATGKQKLYIRQLLERDGLDWPDVMACWPEVLPGSHATPPPDRTACTLEQADAVIRYLKEQPPLPPQAAAATKPQLILVHQLLERTGLPWQGVRDLLPDLGLPDNPFDITQVQADGVIKRLEPRERSGKPGPVGGPGGFPADYDRR